jgi:hypothetical protein
MLIGAAGAEAAGSLTVAWDPNSEPDVAGYILWYGSQPGNYTTSIDVGTQTQIHITNLPNGATYYFAVQAYDTGGLESDLSAEIRGTVPVVLTGPVAAFGFEEGAGAVAGDASPNHNNASLSGATWSAAGRYGYAMSFDGVDDWLTVADSASLDLTGAMTLEAWVNPSALSGWRTVLMKEGASALSYSLYANDNMPKPAVYARIAGDSSSMGNSGTSSLPVNTWTHLAATYDGGSLRIFVNGSEVASPMPLTGSMAASTSPLRIGGNALFGGEYFQGKIDEVRIYARALSPAEIVADMGLPVSNGLAAAFSFDEGSGTTASDSSGNGNNGTVSGATWAAQGKFGGALKFDGVNDRVNVPDKPTLDLTNRFTVEAWVKPSVLTGWRTVLMKETPDGLSYALYANDNEPKPAAYGRINGSGFSNGSSGTAPLPVNAWTHLAATYNGSALALYVNGVQVDSQPVSGNLVTSNNPLSIGGSLVWGEFFEGWIDELRIYRRALTASEIQADMNTAVEP